MADRTVQQTLVVAGAGAAGFFCAVNAARLNPGLRVMIVERTGKLLSKVKVSGGGRCNITHACFEIPEMIRCYPRGERFLKKTFHQFFTTDTIEWFESRGVPLKAEEDGRMFPQSNSSQSVIDCLLKEAVNYQVEIRIHHEIVAIENGQGEHAFHLRFSNGWEVDADFLCLATGGYPKTAMFDWIRRTGHTIEEPVPSLFTFNMPGHPIASLMGVSVPEAAVRVQGSSLKENGPLLITHWGLSGPAVLRLSARGARLLHEKDYRFEVTVNWLPGHHEQSLRESFQEMRRESGNKKVGGKNPFGLPQRLWEWQVAQCGIGDHHWADLSTSQQHLLIQQLTNQVFAVQGKTTFKEEFVTAGGVRLSEVNPNTMESRLKPGLFFAGELLDVDGITGGYNFQHAWTSGFIAAKTIAEKASVNNVKL
ncbi:MAG TPA: NAD(P)/FAD-dependent oxidoreductase [Puia sp.]|nr:NAD(P)/FAD-dependent oxidoreductase [Puia sp.]